MKLSIIIPTYNSADKINRCLDSILISKSNNFECIVINDGSTDNTKEVIISYLKKDNRIKLINIPNSGVSCARNVGLKNAISEFVTFIDSDDYFCKNSIDLIIQNLNQNVDFFIYSYILNNNNKYKKIEFENKHLDRKETIKEHIVKKMDLNSCWSKIYKLDIIKNNNIEFPINQKIGEDSIFVMKYLKVIEKVKFYKNSILVYNNLEGNTMHNLQFEWFNDYCKELMYREEISNISNIQPYKIYPLYAELFFRFFILYTRNHSIKASKNALRQNEILNFKKILLTKKWDMDSKIKLYIYKYLFKSSSVFVVLIYKVLGVILCK